MVLPLVPILAGAGISYGVAKAGDWLWNKGKKDVSVASSGQGSTAQSATDKAEIHAYQEHYAPVRGAETFAPTIGYSPQVTQSYIGSTYVISSPQAQVKKEVVTEQESSMKQIPSFEMPTYGSPRTESNIDETGLDVSKIAIIAVVGAIAVVGIGAIGGKRK